MWQTDECYHTFYPILTSFDKSEKFRAVIYFKGELHRKNKLISYERAFKMLENDMYFTGIGQAVLELLSFKVESENHQRGILYFRNLQTSSVI